MMTYRRSNSLKIVGYSDSDYVGDDRKSISRYVFTLTGRVVIKKLKTNRHYIIYNVYRVCSMLRGNGVGKLAK
jgi:hypothetical protein